MRIGVNCCNLVTANGGIAHYFHLLFTELLANDKENDYVFFWFAHNADELDRLASDRWREHAVLLDDQRSIRSHLGALDLFFCPLNALYPRPVAIPSVVTIADIQEAFLPQLFTPAVLYSRDRHTVGSTHMADCVITISEFSKQTLIEKHRLPEQKIVVSHHCADSIFYDENRTLPPSSQPLPDDFVLYPANFWQHKNHDGLLQALRILRQEQGLAIDAVLTGFPAPNGYPLAAKAAEYGVDSQIHLLGHVSVGELARLYRQARMLVFPSRFEGFGIPLLEAMASGCPVAAAKVASIPEVTGDAALLFDPEQPRAIADAIARLWRDRGLCDAMAMRGRKRAKAFSPARMAAAHLAAFDRAVNSYSASRYLFNAWSYRPRHAVWAEARRARRFISESVKKRI
jgi:glycosyltransferase involved in cell wall biosynthesis